MPWKKMRLRGADVFARVRDDGTFVEEGGRVEVRYRAGASKPYRAATRNLDASGDTALLPDTHCSDVSAPERVTTAVVRSKTTTTETVTTSASKKTTTTVTETVAAIVYADGACSGNPGPAGLGVVILDGKRRVERSEYLGEATNNIAELTAILRALEALPPERAITIHTDSQYSIGVLSRGWKAKKNQDLVASIREHITRRANVRLVYVPGHAGVPLNERADELARQAVSARRTREEVLGESASTSSAPSVRSRRT